MFWEVNHACFVSRPPWLPVYVCVYYMFICIMCENVCFPSNGFPISICTARGNALKFHFSHTAVITYGQTVSHVKTRSTEYNDRNVFPYFQYYYFLYTHFRGYCKQVCYVPVCCATADNDVGTYIKSYYRVICVRVIWCNVFCI